MDEDAGGDLLETMGVCGATEPGGRAPAGAVEAIMLR